MRVLLTPIVHPSAIMRGRWELASAQATYLRRVLNDPARPPKDVEVTPPSTNLYPSLAELDAFYDEALALGQVSVDIESVGQWPLCVGFTAFAWEPERVGSTVCLRFRIQGGGVYWEKWPDHRRATEWLLQLLADDRVGKLFHNGVGFDIPELAHLGIEVRGPVWDTMLMVHSLWSELPKGLQFLCTALLGEPLWKHLTDERDEGEEKG